MELRCDLHPLRSFRTLTLGEHVKVSSDIHGVPGICPCTDLLSLGRMEWASLCSIKSGRASLRVFCPLPSPCGADCCKRMRYINHGLILKSFLSALSTGKEPHAFLRCLLQVHHTPFQCKLQTQPPEQYTPMSQGSGSGRC